MKRTLLTLLAGGALTGIAAIGFFASGLYDVAATDPHWPAVRWLAETARTRSIKSHAAEIRVPSGLDDPMKIVMGTGHFAAHCAACHGAPGVAKDDMGEGMYPLPPDLKAVATRYSAGELFWILKNGIKMSGMPAWSDHSDETLWTIVALLEKLPSLSDADYAALVARSASMGGHHVHRDTEHGAPDHPENSSPDHN